ncbi:ribonuclease T2 family protein [Xylaria arbuscula]|nr:ribonuclease T2 family protein [Xylaria arbuscula]
MPAVRRALALATVFAPGVLGGLYPHLSKANHTCSLVEPVLSCSAGAQPGLTDTCCTETFGGLVLQTQFWSTYTGLEKQGQLLPKDTWTIHGLWPGSYTQYCDLKRQYDPFPDPNTTTGTPAGTPVKPWKGRPISDFIKHFKKFDLLAYMNKFWIAQAQPNWEFWAHEFSKHATCYSTFDTECYGPEYVQHEEIVDFYSTVVSYYQQLPTWRWLAEAGIEPSNKTGYSISRIEDVLTGKFGKLPHVGCAGPKYNETAAGKGSTDAGLTVLSELWYYHHVNGRVQRVQGVPVNSTYPSNCAKTLGAVWYYERTAHSVAY